MSRMNQLAQWGSFLSGVTAVVLIVIVWQQFVLEKDEIASRLRPWVGRHDLIHNGITLTDGRWLSEEEAGALKSIDKATVKSREFVLQVKNYGELPAENLALRLIIRSGSIPEDKDLIALSEAKRAVVMPGEVVPKDISIPFDMYYPMYKGEGKLYMLLRLDYEYQGTTGYYYRLVAEFTPETVESVDAKAG